MVIRCGDQVWWTDLQPCREHPRPVNKKWVKLLRTGFKTCFGWDPRPYPKITQYDGTMTADLS